MHAKETPTQEQISKLPVWAQTYIRNLTRERDLARREMKNTIDTQTPSSVYYDDLIGLGTGSPERFRRYVQTHKIDMEYAGIVVSLSCDSYRNKESQSGRIRLTWGLPDHATGDVMFQPHSFQSAELFLPKQDRQSRLRREWEETS